MRGTETIPTPDHSQTKRGLETPRDSPGRRGTETTPGHPSSTPMAWIGGLPSSCHRGGARVVSVLLLFGGAREVSSLLAFKGTRGCPHPQPLWGRWGISASSSPLGWPRGLCHCPILGGPGVMSVLLTPLKSPSSSPLGDPGGLHPPDPWGNRGGPCPPLLWGVLGVSVLLPLSGPWDGVSVLFTFAGVRVGLCPPCPGGFSVLLLFRGPRGSLHFLSLEEP